MPDSNIRINAKEKSRTQITEKEMKTTRLLKPKTLDFPEYNSKLPINKS